MELSPDNMSPDFRKDLLFTGISLLIVLAFVAGHNYATPDEPVRVGLTEVETKCVGLETSICIGLERQTHTTYNYDNWTDPEPGTENYYRFIESELMARAYNVCGGDIEGMDWTSRVSYRNKTAAEWNRNENVELLPCEKTFYRPLVSN